MDLAYPENLSQIPFFAQKSNFDLEGGVKIVGLFLADFGGFAPIFLPKIGIWFREVKIFIPNLNCLLVLAYPENLRQIQLSLFFC